MAPGGIFLFEQIIKNRSHSLPAVESPIEFIAFCFDQGSGMPAVAIAGRKQFANRFEGQTELLSAFDTVD